METEAEDSGGGWDFLEWLGLDTSTTIPPQPQTPDPGQRCLLLLPFAAPSGADDECRPSKEDDGKRRRRRPAGGSPEAVDPVPVRVEFGYERDFEARYEVGRLLGRGQFGYTFAATDRGSGDRVAVKGIDKVKGRRKK